MILGNRFLDLHSYVSGFAVFASRLPSQTVLPVACLCRNYMFYSFATERFWTRVLSIKYSWHMCFFLFLFVPSKMAWTSDSQLAGRKRRRLAKEEGSPRWWGRRCLAFHPCSWTVFHVKGFSGRWNGIMRRCTVFVGLLFVMHWVLKPLATKFYK